MILLTGFMVALLDCELLLLLLFCVGGLVHYLFLGVVNSVVLGVSLFVDVLSCF